MKKYLFSFLFLLGSFSFAQNIFIKNNSTDKNVTFGNDKIKITLDYNNKCTISRIEINNEAVVSSTAGVFSQVRTPSAAYSTLNLKSLPTLKAESKKIEVNGIVFGDDNVTIIENWEFIISDSTISFEIERTFPKNIFVEEVSFPSINFKSINTWEGAFLGYGGVAWFYLFNEKLCTYGVHTDYSSFWNSKTGNGLKVTVAAKNQKSAMQFTRSNEDELVLNIGISEKEMLPRYDSSVNRRRFIRGKTDVWSGFTIPKGKYTQRVTFTPFNYHKEYNRGSFVGVDGNQLTSVLNTIARIGVIDAKHFGGNSWHTPYGPICLHEQYIAELGLAINDPNYVKGYKECLDFYRDNAIKNDGRVLPRWAYDDSDAMTGTATKLGFYEAQWGYLLDSNPDIVINVADMFNQSGDIKWVATHKLSCEKALDYLLKRDTNGNHLAEMINSDHSERKGSDWIDIIWAAFENAFVNAKLYRALIVWVDVEKQLGDNEKASYYSNYAAQLKASFNKSTVDGGMWDEKKQCYVHWRDKDNSIHGNNMVVPVNFMAIAYGICDDEKRINAILDKIEEQTAKENLFFWPICLYTYEKPEGNDWQFPFPNYENGDIFLSWGSVGVEAYAPYKPEIALKYIKNVMEQHAKDGLAFQRYGRNKQDGRGDDILAGNSLAIAGLYRSILGINPLYNRFYLNPHLPISLEGTEVNYNFRGSQLKIKLDKNRYSIASDQFTLTALEDFGFYSDKNELYYFNKKNEQYSLSAKTENKKNISLDITTFTSNERSWNQYSSKQQKVTYTLRNLQPEKLYNVSVDSRFVNEIKSSTLGEVTFVIDANKKNQLISMTIKGI
ncbi:MAG: hypothetical protein WCZ90_11560 [Melioribacteraceae bacterium]